MTTFDHTRAAVLEFDAGIPSREATWSQVQTNTDVDVCERLDFQALRKVQEAFYLDTKHINSRDNCLRVDIDFMRRMAFPEGK